MTTGSERAPLVVVENLEREFRGKNGSVKALDDVSFAIVEGQTLAIVGESGSGKTTAARVILGLETADAGRVVVDGREVTGLSERGMRSLRRSMQVVLQDPYGQLNRRHTIERIIEAPLRAYQIGSRAARRDRVRELAHSVGLMEAHLQRRPGELSGGQCQRVAIARALALEPRFVVLDEAVSALDLSVRAQVLNLLRNLQDELNLTYLFITHDLSVARYMAHTMVVMNRGQIVETADHDSIFVNPQHEYTAELVRSIPRIRGAR